MIGNLRLTFDNDDDGTGKLQIDVSVDEFATRGAAYFHIGHLRAFARGLLSYPLPEHPRLRIEGGFYSRANPSVLETVLLSVEVYPVGVRGQVGVRVHGETEIGSDRPESRNEATLELLTSYARLADFSREFTEVLEGERKEAKLSEERLS
jgi:hypothetical protein